MLYSVANLFSLELVGRGYSLVRNWSRRRPVSVLRGTLLSTYFTATSPSYNGLSGEFRIICAEIVFIIKRNAGTLPCVMTPEIFVLVYM